MAEDRPAISEPSRGWLRSAALKTLAVFLLALTLGATASLATDLGPEPHRESSPSPRSGWQLEATPYSWLINLDGELEFGAIRQDVYYTFFDIMEDTENPYEIDGAVEARNGPFALFGRLDFLSLTVKDTFTRDFRPIRAFTIDADATIEVRTDVLAIEGGGSLEILNVPMNRPMAKTDWQNSSGGFVAVDVIAGARYNKYEADTDIEVDLEEIFNPRFIPIRITANQRFVARIVTEHDWTDPFVGGILRVQMPSGLGFFGVPMPSGLGFFARGDVGGFHVGSNFAWQVFTGFTGQCKCSDRLSWQLAYRWLDTAYETGTGFERFEYDMLIHGPVSGLTYRF